MALGGGVPLDSHDRDMATSCAGTEALLEKTGRGGVPVKSGWLIWGLEKNKQKTQRASEKTWYFCWRDHEKMPPVCGGIKKCKCMVYFEGISLKNSELFGPVSWWGDYI